MSIQLPQVLIRNSFNILGLSSSASLREIRKRAQQLLQLAKIEEIQEFDTDIGQIREFRNESEIRLALERISGIKERLREIFFWFENHNIENQKAISLIAHGNYQEAIDILEKTNKTSKDWLKYKNLALALIFQAFASSELNNLCRSLALWKHITESEDFWKFYEKHYLLHDELGTSLDLFQEFRGLIYESLSAMVVSFYHQTKNPAAVGAYYSAFGQIGKSIDSEVLQPIVLNIKKEIEDLEKITFELDSGTRQVLEKIYQHFLELDKFELSEYSPLTVLKNNSAEKLRSVSIDIYNQNDSAEVALLFLDQSAKLAVSDAIAIKIESDKRQIKERHLWKTISTRFDRVKELIAERKIEEAKSGYFNLDNELAKQNDETSNSTRVSLFIAFCSQLMGKGHELFDKKMFGIRTLAIDGLLNRRNHKDAIHNFECAVEILRNRICLLNFINPSSDQAELSKIIDSISNSLKSCELTSLIDYRETHLKTIDEIAFMQENENTQIAIRILGVAVCCSIIYRRCYGVTQKKMWIWVGWGFVIALFCWYQFSIQTLTTEEKRCIEYLQSYEPELLKNMRKDGYSDKQISQYVIELAHEEKNDKAC